MEFTANSKSNEGQFNFESKSIRFQLKMNSVLIQDKINSKSEEETIGYNFSRYKDNYC